MALEFPDIDPVALAIGPLEIRWYALAYLAGFILGWRYALYYAGLNAGVRPDKKDIDDFLPWAVLGVILGGRIGYVLFYNLEVYAANPIDALKVWQGGMSFHGGTLGVIAALIGFYYFSKVCVLRLSDMFCAAAPMGIFFGRIANFINGELYGRASDMPWAFIFPVGGDIARHPSQLYEAATEGVLLFLILAFFVHKKSVRERPGIITGTFLVGYGLARSFCEFFREPDIQIGYIWTYFSMGQILSLPMILLGAGLIVYVMRSNAAKISA